MNAITVSAPAKLILSGEHAVVHGYPALAAALSLRLRMSVPEKTQAPQEHDVRALLKKLQPTIESEIPMGSGFGSSAALCVSLATLVRKLKREPFQLNEVARDAQELEKQFHQNSSGIDTTVCTHGGLVWYRREHPHLILKQPLQLAIEPQFALLLTGKPQETTGEMVGMVRERLEATPKKMHGYFRGMEICARGFSEALLQSDLSTLPEIIHDNEILLEKIGVVSDATRALIRKLQKKGFAAKVSGAGGKKEHSGIVMIFHPDATKYDELQKLGLKISLASFSPLGVKYE